MLVAKVCRQRAGGRVAPAVGQFRLQYAGGAGAQENPDSRSAIALAQARDGLLETILTDSQLRQAIIAAFKIQEIVAQGCDLGVQDLADVGFQVNCLKRTMGQAGAASSPSRVSAVLADRGVAPRPSA